MFLSVCVNRALLSFPSASQFNRYAPNVLPNYPLDNKLQHIYNVFMKSVNFSWDDRKNLANQKKHKVSFEEAQSVFFDEHAIEYYDPDFCFVFS